MGVCVFVVCVYVFVCGVCVGVCVCVCVDVFCVCVCVGGCLCVCMCVFTISELHIFERFLSISCRKRMGRRGESTCGLEEGFCEQG